MVETGMFGWYNMAPLYRQASLRRYMYDGSENVWNPEWSRDFIAEEVLNVIENIWGQSFLFRALSFSSLCRRTLPWAFSTTSFPLFLSLARLHPWIDKSFGRLSDWGSIRSTPIRELGSYLCRENGSTKTIKGLSDDSNSLHWSTWTNLSYINQDGILQSMWYKRFSKITQKM